MAELDPNDYNGDQMVVVCIVLLVLTYFSVALRVFVRLLILKTFAWDDWLMIISQITFTLSCTFILVGVHWGLGRHNETLEVHPRIEALKWQTLATLTYVGNMMFIKLSIAVFLLRIATQKRYIWTLKISMGVVTIWSVATILFNIFQCQPVAAQWDFQIENYHCAPGSDFVNAAYAISVMTILTDWLYAIIPIPMIWSVQMTMQKKITVALVLSMGVFASIATLIRVKYLVALGSYDDNLFTATPAMVWTLVEPGVAIIAASLITIRPLLRALNISGFSSGSTRNTSRQQPGGTAQSQTLQNRSQNMNLSQTRGNDFHLKSWNHISAGSMSGIDDGMHKNGLVRTDTTAVSDTGSEEYILRQDERGEVGNDGRETEDDVEATPGSGEIRRTVVVRIQSSPNVIPATGGGKGGTGSGAREG